MSDRRPFTRPIDRFWWLSPTYRHYTIREMTGLAIAIYAAVLFCGVGALMRGPADYAGFIGFLRSPFSLVLHLILLAAIVWHAITWCRILPKTMPKLILDGKPVPQEKITRVATIVMACGSGLLLLVALAAAMVAAI